MTQFLTSLFAKTIMHAIYFKTANQQHQQNPVNELSCTNLYALVCFLRRNICVLFACLYRMLLHLSNFLHFFLINPLHYLSFPLRIEQLRFQAGCRKRRLNLALVFAYTLCCSTFLLIGECVFLLC